MPYKDPDKQRQAARMWAEKNRALVNERKYQRKALIRRYIYNYKLDNSVCVDCNISYPPHILDFDHLSDKEFGLANAARDVRSMESVIEEIAKCEVVCANCHRHRTWSRTQETMPS